MDKKTLSIVVRWLGLAVALTLVCATVIAVASGNPEQAIDYLQTIGVAALASLATAIQQER